MHALLVGEELGPFYKGLINSKNEALSGCIVQKLHL